MLATAKKKGGKFTNVKPVFPANDPNAVPAGNCYMNNPNLKACHVKLDMTRHQLDEYIKCANDVMYFVENYVKIVHVDLGLIPFKVRKYQKRLIRTFAKNRFTICKMPRQTGKTTTAVGYLLWYALFHVMEGEAQYDEDGNEIEGEDRKSIAILANKQDLAIEILDRLKLAYEHLPWFLQQGIKVWNKKRIELEDGTKIMCAATSGSSVRGNSYSLIFLDEFAHIRANLAEEFFDSVYPTISSGKHTQLIMVSTPKGMNKFYKLWVDAENKKNKFIPVSVHWSEVPDRDEKWKAETIANSSERQFAQEHECDFLGSSGTLISPAKLAIMPDVDPVRRFDTQHTSDKLDVLVEPVEGRSYVLCADIAEGVGIDNSTFSVIDVTELPYVQVAKYKSNIITEPCFPDIIYGAANYYNKAFVLIENNFGREVANILEMELEYENILNVSSIPRLGQVVGGGHGNAKKVLNGVKMDKKVKRVGCSTLKKIIESDTLIVKDFDTIAEMKVFIQDKNSYKADAGFHDDLVMTLVLFAWLTTQEYFKDLTSVDARRKFQDRLAKEKEDEVLPMGFNATNTNFGELFMAGRDLWQEVGDAGDFDLFGPNTYIRPR